ncbi:transglutaminaseTgpA domain-containing protein [Pseudoalteromonas sp. MTN2-4]|uniref:transglutaminase family protein n=1 Tax=Pseudoalteromonas sp. MTN2-4 TaxID=3056555 RepID=UPI0036F3510B
MKLNQISCSLMYLLLAWIMVDDLSFVIVSYITGLFIAYELNRVIYKKTISGSIVNGSALAGIALLMGFVGVENSVAFFVSMMLLASLLKIYQAQSERQTMQVFVLNFFTIPCLFIFSQNFFSALLVFILIGFNLALMLIHHYEFSPKEAIKNAFSKLALTIPISVLLVLFIPKLTAFWQLPAPNSAKTGLSENVDPFEISKLSESNELVFRAIFQKERNVEGPLYWRALVHDEFEGTRWNMSSLQSVSANYQASDNMYSYTIIAEPSHLKWLYALDKMTTKQDLVAINVFGLPYRKRPVSSAFEYKVYNVLDTQDNSISRWQYRQNIQLPGDLNPQARALAEQFDKQSTDTAQFIDLLRNYIIEQGFTYTLNPPISQSNNKIDEFLFNNKAGFCGHFASTVAMMMRSVGIPARLVSGYLGGELNPENNYFSIYQYDAHAWLEYYVPNQGWLELDPTAWVSPERLNGSLSQHSQLSEELKSNIGMTLMGFSDVALVNWLRLQLEAFDYQWTRWVLNFDDQKQSSFLKSIFGEKAKMLSAIAVIIGLSLIFAFVYWVLQRSSRQPIPLPVKLLRKLQVSAYGEFNNTKTPRQIILSIQSKYPKLEAELNNFLSEFEKVRYGNKNELEELNKHYFALIKQFKNNKRD